MSDPKYDVDLAALAGSLTVEQRVRVARHIDMVVQDRLYRALHVRAALANAEYRFTDLVDRYVFVVAAGCALLAALYLGVAELALRGVERIGGAVIAADTVPLAWIGLFILLPLYMALAVALLRWRAMGTLWRQNEPPLTARHIADFYNCVRVRVDAGPVAIWLGAACMAIFAGSLPLVFLACLALGCAGWLLFFVYSKLARRP